MAQKPRISPSGPLELEGPIASIGTMQATNDESVFIVALEQFSSIDGGIYSYSGPSILTLTSPGGVLVYNGPPAEALVILSASVREDDSDPTIFALIVSLNNDFAGQPRSFAATAEGMSQSTFLSTDIAVLVCQRRVSLTSGDTLRPLGLTNNAMGMTILGLSMSVELLS